MSVYKGWLLTFASGALMAAGAITIGLWRASPMFVPEEVRAVELWPAITACVLGATGGILSYLKACRRS